MMNTDILGEPQFELGNIFTTPGVDEMITDGLLADLYIDRHWRGDWGDIEEKGKESNEEAITHGDRLLSCFNTPAGRIWIITEADRSTTTLMTPDEY